MIVIVAKSKIKEGKKEEFYTLAKELETYSRQEVGCVSYTLYQDIHDPMQFCYIEQWENQAAIDAHNQSPHFTRLVPLMNALKDESEVSHFNRC